MLLDASNLPDKARVGAEICIIGGGAAGISFALEFLGGDQRVVILEAGEQRYSASSQTMYEGENTGLPYELSTTRSRTFGGSTNCWGGWCRPLAEHDFEKRDWLPESGWPLSRADLNPFYNRAYERCGLDTRLDAGDAESGDKALDSGAVQPFRSRRLKTYWYRQSPKRRFGSTYRSRFKQSQNIRVYLGASVTEIVTRDTGDLVTHLNVRTEAGNTFTVSAAVFVLCSGGIENPRLLLLSQSGQPAGLGNGHDLVGRYFMEHPQFVLGDLNYTGSDASGLSIYDSRRAFARRLQTMATLGLDPAVQKQERILGCAADIVSEFRGMHSPGFKAVKDLHSDLRRGDWKRSQPYRRALTIGRDARSVCVALLAILTEAERLMERRRVIYICEPTPNVASRVTLSHQRDRFGLNRSKLNWVLEPLVMQSVRRTMEIMVEDIRRAKLGDVSPARLDPDQAVGELGWCWHHMGTTRMAASPRRGVVDPNCQVHGVKNLFVGGSSVFPTGGTDLPTLTIIALAIRLADHIKAHVLSAG